MVQRLFQAVTGDGNATSSTTSSSAAAVIAAASSVVESPGSLMINAKTSATQIGLFSAVVQGVSESSGTVNRVFNVDRLGASMYFLAVIFAVYLVLAIFRVKSIHQFVPMLNTHKVRIIISARHYRGAVISFSTFIFLITSSQPLTLFYFPYISLFPRSFHSASLHCNCGSSLRAHSRLRNALRVLARE